MDNKKIIVLHVTEGERWAGIEAHLYSLLPGLLNTGSIFPKLITFYEGPLVEKLKEKGIRSQVLRRRRIIDLSSFVGLVKEIKAMKPDIIHMHGYLSILFGIPAGILAGTPRKVVTLHASPNLLDKKGHKFKLLIYLWIAYMFIKKSETYLIAVSNEIYKSHLEFRKIISQRMKVVHNGIAVKEIQAYISSVSRKDIGISDSDRVVGIIGRIDKNKGHIYFLEAAQMLLNKGACTHFVVIGEGPLEEELRIFCSMNHLDNNVHFLGFRKNILDFLSQMDVMVIASLHEGIPYTLLEAMARGVTVIATEVGGIPEVIQNGVNGLLVPPKDPAAIASCINLLLQNTALTKRLSKAALRILNEQFSQECMVQSTAKVYQELLAYSHPRSSVLD